MDETWIFDAAGTIPEAAMDDIDLQRGLIADSAKDTVYVAGVTAVLPDGTELTGFDSVDFGVEGEDTDAPLRYVNLHWASQPIPETADQAREIATALGMDPDDVDQWVTRVSGNDGEVGGQEFDNANGLASVGLEYRGLGQGGATVIVALLWPRFFRGGPPP